ncbi:MAG: helicase-associated domain-containing protein [Anaerolineales bacterium]|nr:helicase-associated domain-containing protein [Anaerolineales bacterium]
MPDLSESLQGKDLGHLQIVASLWGIALEAPDVRTALRRLRDAMLDPELLGETIAELPPQARTALAALQQADGRIPWAQFVRRYGPLREMGAAKRDREKPHLAPLSAAEVLWYRGLVARAFLDAPMGMQEFAYIPADLIAIMAQVVETALSVQAALGRPATASERMHVIPVNDQILDHATTLLAALRLGMPAAAAPPFRGDNLSRSVEGLGAEKLQHLLQAAGLLDEHNVPLVEPARSFLEAPRGDALAMLVRAWVGSATFNDLRLTSGLRAEGEWVNDPLATRRKVLDFLSGLPEGVWWSLPAFISAVQQNQPDFQRMAGDYDSWFIRDVQRNEFLRGFEHWYEVEGALLRFLICGPLHWLGICELAAPEEGAGVAAFRYSVWAPALLQGQAPLGLLAEDAQVKASSDARLLVPRLAPRSVRYQLARFAEWEKEMPDGYRYRLTATSLQRARQQGLTVGQLQGLLRRHAVTVPPSLARALERWEKQGGAARLEQVLVLRVTSPEVLQALRSSRAARYLGEPLGPASVIVKGGASEKVMAVLAELGYLGESLLAEPDVD